MPKKEKEKKQEKERRDQQRQVLALREEALKTINKGVALITAMLAATVSEATEDLDELTLAAKANYLDGLTTAGVAFALAGMALQDGPRRVLEVASNDAAGLLVHLTKENPEIGLVMRAKEEKDTQKKGGYL